MPQSRLNQKTRIQARERLPVSPYQPRIKIKAGDNWLIPGRKGSGKTTFIKYLIPSYISLYPDSRIYTLDIKFRDYNDYPGGVTSDTCPSLPGTNDRFQTWHCLTESPEEIEKWLWNILHDPPAFVNIDEGLALVYGPRATSEEFKKIQKLGRDLPIGTGFSTQELVQIPRNAIGQADHIVRYRIRHPYEIQLLDNMMAWDSKSYQNYPDKFGFLYMHTDSESPLYFPSVQRFLNIS